MVALQLFAYMDVIRAWNWKTFSGMKLQQIAWQSHKISDLWCWWFLCSAWKWSSGDKLTPHSAMRVYGWVWVFQSHGFMAITLCADTNFSHPESFNQRNSLESRTTKHYVRLTASTKDLPLPQQRRLWPSHNTPYIAISNGYLVV